MKKIKAKSKEEDGFCKLDVNLKSEGERRMVQNKGNDSVHH